MNVSGKLLYADDLIRKTALKDKEKPEDRSREYIKYKEEKSKSNLQYYNSLVKNSHLYPNFEHIRPYNTDLLAGDNGLIQKQAFDNEIFQIGGLSIKRKDLPPAKNLIF